jgi:hypothetical protein
MRYLFLILSGFLILVNSCASVSGQSKKIGEAFVLGFDKVKLYDKIDGSEIGEIQNKELEEVYYSLEVYEQKKDWFKVQAVAMEDTISGWILNKSYLATYSRNYSDTLFVYAETDKKEPICSIPDYFTSPMLIVEFKNNWVRVKIKDSCLSCNGGWIMKNMTCSSPYTTCN